MAICFLYVGAQFGIQRQIIKNGTVVDAECPLHEVVHVWKDENGFFFFFFKLSLRFRTVKIDIYLIFFGYLKILYIIRLLFAACSLVASKAGL